jgi:hypothetical protein
MVVIAARQELESERVYERKLVRELKQDEPEFGDKEKFVTAGYKAILAERRKVCALGCCLMHRRLLHSMPPRPFYSLDY